MNNVPIITLRMNIYSLLRIAQTTLSHHRNLNCWTAAITKPHRKLYLQTYPTYLVFPDGSTINIDYDEPRRIIFLPLNIDTLSEEERRKRLAARKPIRRKQVEEECNIDYDEAQFY